jgi:D-alanyl-D-alanine carboxypeptidase (penicillin-binding protein 5/6)
MASTTKIMTALIAIESGDLTQPVTIHQDSLDRIAAGGSSSQLRLGDTLPLQDMLYALMLPSGDDAAFAIADALAGNAQNFVQRMNLFAYRLHLFQTHYANPDGLSLTPEEDLQHYTSAYDLSRLTEYALQIPLFARVVQTSHYSLPATARHAAYSWDNTNILLNSYTGMLGVKTGFTYAAGYCLVFAAKRNGHELLGVVMHSTGEAQRNQDATSLLNWAFSLPLLPPS